MNDRQREVAPVPLLADPGGGGPGADQAPSAGELVRELAARDHAGPAGGGCGWPATPSTAGSAPIGPAGSRRWPRSCATASRSPRPPSSSWPSALKREAPKRTAAQVAEIIRHRRGLWPVGAHRAAPLRPARAQRPPRRRPGAGVRPVRGRATPTTCGPATPCTARRSPAARPTCSRSSTTTAGPWSAIGGATSEDTVRLEAALRAALAARGVPRAVYVDNGSAFVSLAAAAGAGQPGHPPRPQPARPAPRPGQDRTVLRAPCATSSSSRSKPAASPTWPSSTGCSPPGSRPSITAASTPRPARRRWSGSLAGRHRRRCRPRAAARGVLVVRDPHRDQDRDGRLHGNTYEVDAALVGRRVEVVFDPFDLDHRRGPLPGPAMGAGVPHRDRPPRPPQGPTRRRPPPPPPATGIDYLGLVAARHDAELARRHQLLPARPCRPTPTASRRRPPDDDDDEEVRRDHRPSPRPLGLHPHALRQGPRPLHAAHATAATPKPSPASPGASTKPPSA